MQYTNQTNKIEGKERLVPCLSSLVLCLPTGLSWLPASPGLSFVSPSFHFSIPSSFNSLNIPIHFLPLGLLPPILPSITSFNKPLLRTMCPIHLFLVLVILFNSSLFSSTIIMVDYQHIFICFPFYPAYFFHPSPDPHFKCL